MKRYYAFFMVVVVFTLSAYAQAGENKNKSGGLQEETDNFGLFGTVHIYKKPETPKQVVLFISGDGGWNLGVVDMARSLAELDSMVVGIDITHYIKELNKSEQSCSYGAADFEALSQHLQKKYQFAHYLPPILVGYSSGATMVYTILAQAPVNTFSGGISLGFCPDLQTAKPFCKGNGSLTAVATKKLGFVYQTVDSVVSPWVVLQGDQDQVCSTPDTKLFVAAIKNAELSELPKVGHGFSVPRNWMPQFKEAYQQIVDKQKNVTAPTDEQVSLKDLPLVELPAADKGDTLVVFVSGDGGWASLDKQIAEALNKRGISVVGLNSLQYFWDKKSPETSAADLARILEVYQKSWGSKNFIIAGYSQGADVLPFMINRLPDVLKQKIRSVSLLGLEAEVDFEFHVSNWVSSDDSGHYPVVPEVKKLAGVKVTCIYGDEEKHSACQSLDMPNARVIEMKGGHHFGGDYARLAEIIVEGP
jgi:type IV secretory pathway VirJ component